MHLDSTGLPALDCWEGGGGGREGRVHTAERFVLSSIKIMCGPSQLAKEDLLLGEWSFHARGPVYSLLLM